MDEVSECFGDVLLGYCEGCLEAIGINVPKRIYIAICFLSTASSNPISYTLNPNPHAQKKKKKKKKTKKNLLKSGNVNK